jgi:hypothetical protein
MLWGFFWMNSKKFLISAYVFLFAIIGLELSSYNLSSDMARIALFSVFFGSLFLLIVIRWSFSKGKIPFDEKFFIFTIILICSLIFLIRRFYYLDPNFITALSDSQIFARVQFYSDAGTLVFNSANSYFFQHSFLLYCLTEIGGFSLNSIVYVSLGLHLILVALAGSFVYSIILDKTKDGKFASYMAPLVSFGLVSFSYSERIEIGLPIAFFFLVYLFANGLEKRSNELLALLFVLGITFGSTTALLVIAPLFFIFAILRKRYTAFVFGLIPLSYLIYAGSAYTYGLRDYVTFATEGISNFLTLLTGGTLPERILPWGRSSLSTLTDTYMLSSTYVALILVSTLIAFTAFFVWFRNRSSFKENDTDAFFVSGVFTLFLTLAIAAFVYIGASVQPETPFSDIRTIAIVFMTLLIAPLLISERLIKKITSRRFLFILFAVLLVAASLRTFYEVYPKSINDPINAVEDFRIDPLSAHYAVNYLSNFTESGEIAFDYKTSRASIFLNAENYNLSIITTDVPDSGFLVYNVDGLLYGSIHTRIDAYEVLNNRTLTGNVVYSGGKTVILQQQALTP